MTTPEVAASGQEPSPASSARKFIERLGVTGETKERLTLLWQKLLKNGEEQRKQSTAQSEERDKQEFLSKRNSIDAVERARAASVLPLRHQKQWLLPLLPRLFSDPDPRVRAALVKNLFIRDRQQFFALYEPLLQDPSPLVRTTVINTWLELLWHRPDLVKSYLTDDSEEVRAAMAKEWYPFMGHFDLVRRLFIDRSPIVRNAVRQNRRLLFRFPEGSRRAQNLRANESAQS